MTVSFFDLNYVLRDFYCFFLLFFSYLSFILHGIDQEIIELPREEGKAFSLEIIKMILSLIIVLHFFEASILFAFFLLLATEKRSKRPFSLKSFFFNRRTQKSFFAHYIPTTSGILDLTIHFPDRLFFSCNEI